MGIDTNAAVRTLLTFFISAVWLVNGLFCKVLGLVPRHEEIVARILGIEYSAMLTIAIGVAEVFMAVWVLSRIRARLCALTQIVIVAAMNVIELFLASDLLLFGKWNLFIAGIFIGLVYYNEFVLGQRAE